MSIFDVGVDIVEISRIAKSIENLGDNFLKRIFSEAEIEYCNKKIDASSFAARFAAKEAVLKATGLGLREEMSWLDIEVINDVNGKPSISLNGKTREILAGKKIHLSLSHSKTAAIAMVVVEDAPKP